ncbi:acyltransferase family protein [Serratia bockelmannii]|uniref:acyltransferase family protein n=1 Tax=Serratia bockelmannii TaxID=2703793 RepID=UPI0024796919|nr:acyltransferase [Serratia bockelmannii]MDH7588579.1 acyltransferase [Serratia bockelmannii]
MGYFRFILAALVCSNHLWIIGGVGRYAVFSFYILSGYLMTTVVCERYGTSFDGIKRYAVNRLLRIYPIYLLVFFLTIISIIIWGAENTHVIDPNLSIPSTIKGWLMNTTLIGLNFDVQERTIPPSWTLFIELFFYAVIPFAIRLGSKFITFWVIISVIYHVYFLHTATDAGLDWNSRYGTIFAGSLGFSLGCAARFLPMSWLRFKGAVVISILGLVLSYAVPTYFMLAGYTDKDWRYISTYTFYLSIAFSLLFIVNSININQSSFGRLLGELSYPLYLVHIPAGFILVNMLTIQPRTFYTFALCFVFSIAISLYLHLIDRKINKVRDKVRPIAKKSPA